MLECSRSPQRSPLGFSHPWGEVRLYERLAQRKISLVLNGYGILLVRLGAMGAPERRPLPLLRVVSLAVTEWETFITPRMFRRPPRADAECLRPFRRRRFAPFCKNRLWGSWLRSWTPRGVPCISRNWAQQPRNGRRVICCPRMWASCVNVRSRHSEVSRRRSRLIPATRIIVHVSEAFS